MSAAGTVLAKEARFASPWARALALTAALGLHAVAAFTFLRPHAALPPEDQAIEVTVEADPTPLAPPAPGPWPVAATPEQTAAPVEPAKTAPPEADTSSPPEPTPTVQQTTAPVEPARTPPPEPSPTTPEQIAAPVEPPQSRPSPAPEPPKESLKPIALPSPVPPPRPILASSASEPAPVPTAAKPPALRARPSPSPERTARPRRPQKDDAEGGRSAAGSREEERARPARGRPAAADAPSVSSAAYGALVSAEIARHKFYPPAARAAGVSGSVGVMVTIGAGGRVVSHAITRSSGHPELDGAVAAILSAVQVPPPPGGVFRASLTLRFAID